MTDPWELGDVDNYFETNHLLVLNTVLGLVKTSAVKADVCCLYLVSCQHLNYSIVRPAKVYLVCYSCETQRSFS